MGIGSGRFIGSTLALTALLATTALFSVQDIALAADKIEWRPLIKRTEGEVGAEKANYPEYFNQGKYGSEGYQYIHGAAVHADGTVLMGQDMGSARVSTDFGKTWYTPPNAGNPLIGGNSSAIDPADSNVMFIAMAANSVGNLVPALKDLEGIYRSADKGQSWTLQQEIPGITYGGSFRDYKSNLAYYPTTGGSVSSRIWWFATSENDGGLGSFWKSTNGGIDWVKVTDLSFSTYGAKYALVQHPTTQNTLYMCTDTGLWSTTNGGANWSRPWNTQIPGATRSLWIDPDNVSHMLVSVETGIWETTSGGSTWSNIKSGFTPGTMAVGAKNGSNQRMIYVHNAAAGGKAYIRQFNGTWINNYDIEASDPDNWNQQSITGQQQDVFLPHPTIPDLAIAHGRNFWWRSEGTEGSVWEDSSTNFFGSAMRSIFFDENDWKKFDVAAQDSGSAYTDNGALWMSKSNITGKAPGSPTGQWQRMIDKVGSSSDLDARSGRSIVRLPDPWPSGVPAAANSDVPGRRIMTLGGTTKHFIFTQNKTQTTWNDWIENSVATGGDGTRRNYAFYSRQNPNIVYAGPNVSTNGGTSWGVTNDQKEIVAMSYLNGDIVYAVDKVLKSSNPDVYEYEIKKSTSRGIGTNAWTTIFTTTWNIRDSAGSGRVAVDPNSDNRLYIKNTDGDVLLLKYSGGTWVGNEINLNLKGQFSSPGDDWAVERIVVDWSDSKLIYALINISGQPNVWRGTLNAGFTSSAWEDISHNAPRIAMSSNIHVDPVTGDLVLTSGNGNFVYPAPDSWQHVDTNKQIYKRALWKNLPLPVPGKMMSANFNSLPVGSAPGGWTVSGAVTVQAVPNTAGNHYMKLNDTGASALSAAKTFSTQSGSMTAEYSFMLPSAVDNASVALTDGSGSTAVMIKTLSGQLAYKNPSGSWVNLQAYSANTWYNVKIEADAAADTFSLYINGDKKLTNQAFNTNVSSISKIAFETGAANTGVMYADNVYITRGYIVYDTFNSGTSGSAPAGWTVSGAVTVANVPDSANKSMRLNDTGATSLSASKSFTAQTGVTTAQFSFMVPADVDFAGVQLEDASGVTAALVKTRFGKIVYKKADGSFLNLLDYSPNTWYSIKIVADATADTCTVYVNGEEKVTDLPLTSTTIGSISKLNFVTGSTYTGSIYIDNPIVYTE